MVEALVEAAELRLRPILMTTGAMVLGAVPLALASGAGAESRSQIGWVIVGGMSFGTLLTLFVVPVAYTYLARKRAGGACREAAARRCTRPSTASVGRPGLAAPACAALLQPDRDAFARAGAVDHRDPDEALARRLPGGLAAARRRQHRRAIDQPGIGRRAAGDLEVELAACRPSAEAARSILAPSGGKASFSVGVAMAAHGLRHVLAQMPQRRRQMRRRSRRWRPSAAGRAADRCRAGRRRRTGSARRRARPTRPGTAPLSARPTQTPMVCLRSKPDRPGIAIAIGGAGLVGDAAGRGVQRRRRAEQACRRHTRRRRASTRRGFASSDAAPAAHSSGSISPPRASPT